MEKGDVIDGWRRIVNGGNKEGSVDCKDCGGTGKSENLATVCSGCKGSGKNKGK